MTLALDLLPYAHPSVAGARALTGVLAPRPSWSRRDLARLTRLFATRAADELHQAARFDPVQPWRLRLAATEQVEVWLQTWLPGQGTGPHQHGGAAGAYTILLGELTGTWRSGRGRTRQAVRVAGSGASFDPDGLHALQNRGTIEAISVHAYSPPLSYFGSG
jgi:predicted metal-dependent enzyme (double-stranded beta helix superfamily)